MTEPKVSVVIPTYDRGRMLGRALESVLAQTEQAFEVLVVDDGSPLDEQGVIVAGYGDPRLHYTRLPERRGPASARNTGIRLARAPYVAFLDDDDEWLPEKLARQLAVLEAAPASVAGVCTARYTVNRLTGAVVETRWPATRFDRPIHESLDNFITTSSLMVRRQCFDTVGVFDEDPQLASSEDFDLWLRISPVYRFVYLDEPLVRYFIHGEQLMTNYGKRVRALTRIVEKHAGLYARDRKILSRTHVELALLSWHGGDRRGARKAVWKAFRIDARSTWLVLTIVVLSFFRGDRPRMSARARSRLATNA